MATQFDPASGTRDFLAEDVAKRERAFDVIRTVFARYGFEPLQTPAFERLDVLMGKYGEDGDKLVFKILRRGEHEASGEADLALRYDHTVPLARVAAAYGSRLPSPYKRYVLGPVWRAERPGKDRYREFVQCDLDTLGSASPLADAEVLCAHYDALAELGIGEFRVELNSRRALAGLLEAFGVPADLGPGVLITLDKLDKLAPAAVTAELGQRGLDPGKAAELVDAMTAPDSVSRIRDALKQSEEGSAGPRRGGPGAVAGFRAAAARPDRVHPAPGARAQLLHRADLGADRTGSGGLDGRGRPLRPPDRATRRARRARPREPPWGSSGSCRCCRTARGPGPAAWTWPSR